jgi:4a-hydroxytetrahydrobiopterin dehydratase
LALPHLDIANMRLIDQRCVAGAPALSSAEILSHQAQTPLWQVSSDGRSISREFRFSNFYLTMSFVNALAHLANREDHHPDLEVSYGRCLVRLNTHDVGGLSLNDFILAAQIDAL